MDPSAIERAAELLAQVRQTRQRLGRLPEDCRPGDLGAAYAVQDALHHRLAATGWGALAGHKIGCTTPVMQRFLGIGHPCAGGVFAPTVQHEDGVFRHADFLHVGVECEIAVRLARDLSAPAAPYVRSDVADAVGACLAAIEVVDDRYACMAPCQAAVDGRSPAVALGRCPAARQSAAAASLPPTPCASEASRNASMSPSSTPWALPFSTPVRRSLTI
jgi:2-keto-4-pentenoate hydratase